MALKAASLEKLWEKVAILSLATALKGNRCLYRTRLWYDTAGSWDDVIWIVDMQDWGDSLYSWLKFHLFVSFYSANWNAHELPANMISHVMIVLCYQSLLRQICAAVL